MHAKHSIPMDGAYTSIFEFVQEFLDTGVDDAESLGRRQLLAAFSMALSVTDVVLRILKCGGWYDGREEACITDTQFWFAVGITVLKAFRLMALTNYITIVESTRTKGLKWVAVLILVITCADVIVEKVKASTLTFSDVDPQQVLTDTQINLIIRMITSALALGLAFLNARRKKNSYPKKNLDSSK